MRWRTRIKLDQPEPPTEASGQRYVIFATWFIYGLTGNPWWPPMTEHSSRRDDGHCGYRVGTATWQTKGHARGAWHDVDAASKLGRQGP